MKTCTVQLFESGRWHDVAVVRLLGSPSQGVGAPVLVAYATDWAVAHAGSRDAHALSAALPVSLEFTRCEAWPAFLVDLLPQGHGRAELTRLLGLPDGPTADWELLSVGAGNPIGHLRIKEAHAWLVERAAAQPQQGFTLDEIGARAEPFLEYLGAQGLFVAGSSGV